VKGRLDWFFFFTAMYWYEPGGSGRERTLLWCGRTTAWVLMAFLVMAVMPRFIEATLRGCSFRSALCLAMKSKRTGWSK